MNTRLLTGLVVLLVIIGPVRASWDSETEAVMPASISGYPLDSSHIVRGTAAHGCYHAYQISNPDLVYPFVKKPSGVILSCGTYGTGIGTDLAGEIVQVWIKYDESSCYSVEQSNALADEIVKYTSGRQTFDVDGVTIIEQAHTDSSNHVYAGYSFYLGHFHAGALYEHVGPQTDSQRREKPVEAIRQTIQKIEAIDSCATGSGTAATPTSTPTAIPTSYSSEECKSVDLSGMPVYKVDLAEHKCSSWTETKSDGYYKIGCNLEAGTVRAYGINAVSVPSGAETLRIKATLKTTDSSVHYDDYADLIVFTMDKGPELSLTCGKSTTDWPNECVIKDRTTGSLGHCGLPKYTGSRACDFTVDVSGLNTVYLTFSMSDPWDLAFGALKDSFENVEICVETPAMPTQTVQPTATPTPTPTSTPTETPTAVPTKNLDGQSCFSDSECESGNCRGIPNGICCMYGKQCCRTAHLLCVPGYECGPEHYCVPEADTTSKKPNGSRCTSDSRCLSGHCQYWRCCDAGKTCCEYTSNCPDDYYCGSFSTCTLDQRPNGYPCMSDAGCLSGWCSLFKCADKREIVVSAGPETEPEAGQIKRMIEKDIYPAIADVFGTDSGKVLTGPRDYDYEIKLQLVFDTPTAMWDEKTNTLYVPASKVYADMGAYSPKMMQLNALAHELTHYHLNGFALKDGGDFGKVPLWFREGLAEYGAHVFYKEYMDSSALSGYLGGMVIPPTTSVSEAREIRFRDYLSDGTIQYKETIESNALDKVSWLSESGMDTRLNEYAHVYYGAAFSFVNYLLGKDTYKEGESMMDVAEYMFMMGSKGKFGFYGHADDEKTSYSEKSIKMGWFKQFINKHEIDTTSLKSKPGLIKTIADGIGSIFKGLLSIFKK